MTAAAGDAGDVHGAGATVVLFAAPHVTENATSAIAALLDLPGVRLGLVSQEPVERLPTELRERLAAHWRVDDALRADQLEWAGRELQATLGTAHRYFAAVEQLQLPLAEARERLGIVGLPSEVVRNFRDKARMKQRLRDAGLPCARHCLASSDAEALAFAVEVGYPLVTKPPAGAASQDTFRVDDADALAAVLRDAPPAPGRELLLEEFVTGEEYSFDAYCLDGRVVFHSITRYDPTPLEVMRTPWIQWMVLLPREIDGPWYDDIRDVAGRALTVLGMRTGMCHLEWFRRADHSLAISEVAARPPGAQFTTLISRAHDIDAMGAWARLMVFDRFDEPMVRRYAAGAAYLRGQGAGAHVHAVRGLDTVWDELGDLITDARIPVVGQAKAASYEGEGFIIVRDPETAVVADALRRIVSLARVDLGS